MLKNIKILIHYNDLDNSKEKRKVYLSSLNKINYIISVLKRHHLDISIISASNSDDNRSYPKSERNIDDHVKLTLLHGFRRGNWLVNKFSTRLFSAQLFLYLLFHIQKNDTVLIYHSLAYMQSVKLLKKIKKFNLIMEVEEIYGYVSNQAEIVKKEMDFFKLADAYVFPTMLLNQKINKYNKPYAISHGTYHVEPDRKTSFQDSKIHCVYAGTFDSRKGVLEAIAAAAFLPNNYHIHVLGFGNETETQAICNQIKQLSLISQCTISYDGCLSGEEYIRFIQSCQIGLSTQNPNAAFNDTSFPSKILSYMSNNLRVVSIRIPAIEQSDVGKYLYYYDTQNGEEIAKAIKSVEIDDEYDGRKIISMLDEKFLSDLGNLINAY